MFQSVYNIAVGVEDKVILQISIIERIKVTVPDFGD